MSEIPQHHQPKLRYTDTEHVVSELTHRYGIEPSEVATAAQQAEVMQPYTRVVVRAPLSALSGIVHDGRIGTVNETRVSNGLTAGADKDLDRLDEYVAMRQQFETEQLKWTDAEPRIVYGFLGYSDELGDTNIQAPTYGRVELKLRAEVADRSTFTIGDSLSKAFGDYHPVDFLDHSDATLVQQAIELGRQQDGHGLNQVPYVEAQVRRGVVLQDIESVSITIKPRDLESMEAVLSELHQQAPGCKIVVNLDFTTPNGLPLDIVKSLSFVEFRPVVINNAEPIFIQRRSVGYQNSGNYQEHRYNEKIERVGVVSAKLAELSATHSRPDNLGDVALSHFRNGDRFPPNG